MRRALNPKPWALSPEPWILGPSWPGANFQPMADFLDSTRRGYDVIAAEYALRYFDELQYKPLDRALLDRLVVDVGPLGPICDLGCGPGQIAYYLRRRGADVVGIDLSPKMVAEASWRNPDVAFAVGDMLALDVPDASWGGIAAFYSLIHIPRPQVPDALAECRRVLKPGGRLLVACHVGTGALHIDDWWGRQVSLDFYLFEHGQLESSIREAGFDIVQTFERDPIPNVEYPSHRVCVLARSAA